MLPRPAIASPPSDGLCFELLRVKLYEDFYMPKTKTKTKTNRMPNSIRQYRRKRHFKLKDISLLVNQKSSADISHWEKGRKLPSLVNALKLSAILKCLIEILFSDLFNSIRNEVFKLKEKYNLYGQHD